MMNYEVKFEFIIQLFVFGLNQKSKEDFEMHR